MGRFCARCERDLPRSSYTAYEYSKGRGISRCVTCDRGHHSRNLSLTKSNSGRYNESNYAIAPNASLSNPFAQGTFRWVAMGNYTSGRRKGQPCVLKWFKTGGVFSDDYFTLEIKAVDKALEIIDQFNQSKFIKQVIKMNIPEVWRFSRRCEGDWAGQLFLCEPFIENYRKFNSNSGWNDDSTSWGRVMQALSHFSYHISGGFYLLCDLQGGVYRHEVILSDPVIMSRNGEHGITDLGPDGIITFFSRHVCNEFCRPKWIKPAPQVKHFPKVPGTTMIRRKVPKGHTQH